MDTPKPQHMAALDRANEVRLARAELKRRIGRREVTVAEVLDPDGELPAEAVSMRVSELLEAQIRWGRTRARRLLNRLSIRENRKLGDLTERQRGLLVGELCPAGERQAA
jgi:hypothetical protein